jgi:hypothetical protein
MAFPILLTPALAQIAPGASLSAPTPLGAGILAAVFMPAVWAAAALTWQVSADGGATWQEYQDGTGAAVTQTVTGGVAFWVLPAQWTGVNMVRVRSGTLAAPVPQPAGALITLQTVPEA